MPLPASDSESNLSDIDANVFEEMELLYDVRRKKPSLELGYDEEGDANQAVEHGGHCQFLNLPAELRLEIYQLLLPHNMTLYFERFHLRTKDGRLWGVVYGMKPGDSTRYDIVSTPKPPFSLQAIPQNPCPVVWQVFLINKFISEEARAVFYGSNTYKFIIGGIGPLSPTFGPFECPDRLPLLRYIRKMHFIVFVNWDTHRIVKEQRARLECLVEVLKTHAGDEEQKSLLQELKIEVNMLGENQGGYCRHRARRRNPLPVPESVDKFMFGLESLAALRNIRKVEFIGLPDWYTQCLELCIQGKGGDVLETNWPLVQVKRQRDYTKRAKKVWVSARKWHNPTLNWKEFAERNNIAIPEDIDRFWSAST